MSDTTISPPVSGINFSPLASSSGSVISLPILDAYVNVDCDEYHIGQTVTRPKTCTPVWNEDYQVIFF